MKRYKNKAEPTPSAYSAHVFVGKHVNTPSQIYCSDWGGASTPILTKSLATILIKLIQNTHFISNCLPCKFHSKQTGLTVSKWESKPPLPSLNNIFDMAYSRVSPQIRAPIKHLGSVRPCYSGFQRRNELHYWLRRSFEREYLLCLHLIRLDGVFLSVTRHMPAAVALLEKPGRSMTAGRKTQKWNSWHSVGHSR